MNFSLFSESLLLTDPVFNKDDSYVLDRSQAYDRGCQKALHMLKLLKKYNISKEGDIEILER